MPAVTISLEEERSLVSAARFLNEEERNLGNVSPHIKLSS